MTAEQVRAFRRAVRALREHGRMWHGYWYPYVVSAGEAFGIREDCPEWGRLYAAVGRWGDA